MKELRRLAVLIPAVALVGLLLALYMGRGTMEQLAFLRRNVGAESGPVDQRPFQTAQTLAALAVSAEEQNYAQDAERLADHEVDQAFATALRKASMGPRMTNPRAQALNARVNELKALVKDDQARVDTLTQAAKTSGIPASEGDDLDVAKAQLGLDSDELTDAAADLARATGDDRDRIQQELEAREQAMKKTAAAQSAKGDTAVIAARRYATLSGRASAWFAQRERADLLRQARETSLADAHSISAEHDRMEQSSESHAAAAGSAVAGTKVRMLEGMAAQRVMMSILDDRAQTFTELADTYGRWESQVWLQHRIVGYLLLQSLAQLAGIVLLASLAALAGRKLVRRVATDKRRAATLETIVTLTAEAVGLLGVLLVVFGVPQEMPTILGLATAGLTVVFQDFILAFFGWFVLMGRNGIRVGDWVEINSVGGEVAEIGLFRTSLLETGNWTSRGHPTGRRVTFINSFAIRGQFFNFSTHGQWMWDEIELTLPATTDPYAVVSRMQQAVERETASNSDQAEAEWLGATRHNGMSQFSARPTVDLRPGAAGFDVVVRFVTRAGERFDQRNRLYAALMEARDDARSAENVTAPALG